MEKRPAMRSFKYATVKYIQLTTNNVLSLYAYLFQVELRSFTCL